MVDYVAIAKKFSGEKYLSFMNAKKDVYGILNKYKIDNCNTFFSYLKSNEMFHDFLKEHQIIKFGWNKLFTNRPLSKKDIDVEHAAWMDYGSMWKDKKDNVIGIFQPCQISDMFSFNYFHQDHGLEYIIRGDSWHNPGRAILIQVINRGLWKE